MADISLPNNVSSANSRLRLTNVWIFVIASPLENTAVTFWPSFNSSLL